MSNKSFSLFISLMATIAIWNLSSCDNSGTAASGEDVVTTAHVEEEAAKPGEMAEGSEETEPEEAQDVNEGELKPSGNPSSDTWTGASSEEELRRKLDGTYWHSDPSASRKERLFIYEFHFFNGKISIKTFMNAKANARQTDKRWIEDEEFIYPSYEIKYHSRGDFLSVDFGNEEDLKLEYRSFSIAFMENCRIATLFQFSEPDGMLKFGRFNPNN